MEVVSNSWKDFGWESVDSAILGLFGSEAWLSSSGLFCEELIDDCLEAMLFSVVGGWIFSFSEPLDWVVCNGAGLANVESLVWGAGFPISCSLFIGLVVLFRFASPIDFSGVA